MHRVNSVGKHLESNSNHIDRTEHAPTYQNVIICSGMPVQLPHVLNWPNLSLAAIC